MPDGFGINSGSIHTDGRPSFGRHLTIGEQEEHAAEVQQAIWKKRRPGFLCDTRSDTGRFAMRDPYSTGQSISDVQHVDAVQGNIIAGFQKDHQIFAFLRFADDAGARAWLAEMIPLVATTAQVGEFNRRFSTLRRERGGEDPPGMTAVWVGLALTAHGLTTLAPTLAADLRRPEYELEAFATGPAARAETLGDVGPSAPDRWVVGGAAQEPVDVLLTVAADEPEDLEMRMNELQAIAVRHGVVTVFQQRGDALPREAAGHEHFGFREGVSQPAVRGFDPTGQLVSAGEFVLGHPREPIPDDDSTTPRPHPSWMYDGSFQVFRRLTQDVPGWWAQVGELAASVFPPMAPDALAARLMGRWRNGTPTAVAPDQDDQAGWTRNSDSRLTYDDDPTGERTPLFAHTRRMYPRRLQTSDVRRRIIRRGLPFGPPFNPSAGRGQGVDAERGLLFNAYMASIPDQFEFLQRSHGSYKHAARDERPESDAVVTTNDRTFTLRRPAAPPAELRFERFVQTTGALYAFVPSLLTLRELAADNFRGPKFEDSRGVLRYTHRVVDASPDPALVNNLWTYELLQNVFEGLVRYDAENRLVPSLAEKYEVKDGGRVYRFRLRSDARFHSPFARRVTAADVKYSLERALMTKSEMAAAFLGPIVGSVDVLTGRAQTLEGIEVHDERELTITIDQPRSYFIGMLTWPTGWVVCREAIESAGGFFTAAAAIGTGPFRMQRFAPTTEIVLTANDDYRAGPPGLARIERPVMYDLTLERGMYDHQQIDVAHPTVPDFLDARDDAGLREESQLVVLAAIVYLAFQLDRSPVLASADVRRAFALAIDLDELIEIAGRGTWTRADQLLPPGVPGHEPDFPRRERDIGRAAQLLAQAGYPGGRGFPSLQLQYIAGDPQLFAIADTVAAQLVRNLAIDVQPLPRVAPEHYADRISGRMPFYLAGGVATYLDPHDLLSNVLRSDASLNVFGYRNADVDELCAAADVDQDQDRRIELYRKAQRIALDDGPIIPLTYGTLRLLVKPHVEGVTCNLLNLQPHISTRFKPSGGRIA